MPALRRCYPWLVEPIKHHYTNSEFILLIQNPYPDQRVDDGRLEAEHGKLDYRDSTDDEEVRLLPHRRGVDEPDPPGSDIGERPPVVNDRTGVLNLEATGGMGVGMRSNIELRALCCHSSGRSYRRWR